jgi:hypothetical protein
MAELQAPEFLGVVGLASGEKEGGHDPKQVESI